MRWAILALALLALLLAGCGPVASPTHYEYDNHAVTTTTTTTTEQSQDGVQTCIGLVVIGSCNRAMSNAQTRPAAAPALAPVDGLTLEDVVKAFLIAAAITAVFVMLMMGLRWIFPDSEGG
jgi:hypothetical protein